MIDVAFDNLNDALIEAIPQLRDKYVSECEWWGTEKPGPHIIYGDILNPYITHLLESEQNEEYAKQLERIFDFIELLANSPDEKVQEVVSVTVCEGLGDNDILLQKARKYMKGKTCFFSREIEQFWRGQ